MCVGCVPIQAVAVAEGLGVRLELDVCFDANDRLELVGLRDRLAECSGTKFTADSAAEPIVSPA